MQSLMEGIAARLGSFWRMTPVEALKSATSASAAVLGLEAEWQPEAKPSLVMPGLRVKFAMCTVCQGVVV